MLNQSIFRFFGLAGLAFVLCLFYGCEETGQPRQPSINSKESASAQDDENAPHKSTTLARRFQIEPFNYHAYPEKSVSGEAFAIEYGYVDMRELHGSNTAQTFDYRWHRMGARAGKGVLNSQYKFGCRLIADHDVASDKNVKELEISGAVESSLRLSENYFRYSEKNDFANDYSQTIDVAFISDDEQTNFEAPPLPTQGSIQIVGDYTGTISSGMVLSELNSALPNATEDFKLADIGTGEGYNLVIVDFYGSRQTQSQHLRCYIDVEDTVTIPITLFKSLAPIKIAMGLFVNMEQNDNKWSASIIGSGVEDVSFD